jgi:hypothetical protein
MPKFQKNKGFKMPGIGSKEKHTPGNFREEHHVDKMGYCDDTPLNMLPPGSSPVTFMGNEPLASSSDGSPLSYQWSLDDDPYTSVKYTPGALDQSDIFTQSEANSEGKQGGIEEEDKIEIELGTGDYSGGGSFKNQAEKDWYDDQITQRINKGMSKQEAKQDYRNTFKIGTQDKDVAVVEGVKGKFKRTK